MFLFTGTNELEEWGEFLHSSGKIFKMEEIYKEIEEQTDRVAGKNRNICHQEIRLEVFSPNVYDLTLVDLPGVTKVGNL